MFRTDHIAQTQAELNGERLTLARALLVRPRRTERTWPALAAAALFAMSATAFAVVTILAPAPPAERSALRE
jgi:hypothetical protein